MAVFELKTRSQWQGHPGTLESSWKLFNASNHIYINRKTWSWKWRWPDTCSYSPQLLYIHNVNPNYEQKLFHSQGMILNGLKKNLFSEYVNGTQPHPPFWISIYLGYLPLVRNDQKNIFWSKCGKDYLVLATGSSSILLATFLRRPIDHLDHKIL